VVESDGAEGGRMSFREVFSNAIHIHIENGEFRSAPLPFRFVELEVVDNQ
jgi:hypothetical protein